ncbi:MAG TPA: polymer-forming cytoskeletal protein [Longimicrobium sp.]|nr:polymer-forming cytoskeletal protein [Longimicrobium sp.]
MTFRPTALAAALLLLLARPLAAQDIQIAGDDRSPGAELARQILARGNYLRFDRDTVLPATFRAPGDVVIYDADVRLEGTIEGSVAVIGGHFFVRPRAVIRGDIALVGGEVYSSSLATMGRVLETRPRTQVALPGDTAFGDTAGYAARIITPPPARLVSIATRPLPSYDRVNGVTLTLGARILPTRNDSGPRLNPWISYRFENPDRLGGGLRVAIPLRVQGIEIQGEASRATRTNDAWQRGDLSNSVSVLTTGRDYRDYYDADLAQVMVARPVGKPLIAGESWLNPRVGVQWEDARSLRTKDVFSIWQGRDKDRPNPEIAEGTIVSAFGGAEVRMVGRVSQFTGSAQVERSFGGSAVVEDFTRVEGDATYTATAFRTHTLTVYLRGAAPLASDAPPQRYQILGGPSTIPTLRLAHYRGDHLAFMDARYSIPLPLQVPFMGAPNLVGAWVAGAAWEGDSSPPWTHNIGVGIGFTLGTAILYADPTQDIGKARLLITAAIPRVF